MNNRGSSFSPQEALKQLLQADQEADRRVDRANAEAEQIVSEARQKAETLLEEARSEAEAEAEEIVKQGQSEAEAQRDAWLRQQAAKSGEQSAYSADVEALRQQAEQNLDGTVDLLVAWVTAQEL